MSLTGLTTPHFMGFTQDVNCEAKAEKLLSGQSSCEPQGVECQGKRRGNICGNAESYKCLIMHT